MLERCYGDHDFSRWEQGGENLDYLMRQRFRRFPLDDERKNGTEGMLLEAISLLNIQFNQIEQLRCQVLELQSEVENLSTYVYREDSQ